MVLATDGEIEVVGGAKNGARAVALVGDVRPDEIVLDLVMPVMEGMETLGLILRDGSPPPGVAMLTMRDQSPVRREFPGMRASTFLSESASLAGVIGAVKGTSAQHSP